MTETIRPRVGTGKKSSAERLDALLEECAAKFRKGPARKRSPRPTPAIDTSAEYHEDEPESPTYIYFIQAASGPIKVGFSQFPKTRFGALQSGHYEELTLLGVMVGTLAKEQQLHKRFARRRIRGEWFQPTKPLLKFIDKNAIPYEGRREGGAYLPSPSTTAT